MSRLIDLDAAHIRAGAIAIGKRKGLIPESGWHAPDGQDGPSWWHDLWETAEAALSALPTVQAGAGEPVAWQWRSSGEWHAEDREATAHSKARLYHINTQDHVRPLYAEPSPASPNTAAIGIVEGLRAKWDVGAHDCRNDFDQRAAFKARLAAADEILAALRAPQQAGGGE